MKTIPAKKSHLAVDPGQTEFFYNQSLPLATELVAKQILVTTPAVETKAVEATSPANVPLQRKDLTGKKDPVEAALANHRRVRRPRKAVNAADGALSPSCPVEAKNSEVAKTIQAGGHERDGSAHVRYAFELPRRLKEKLQRAAKLHDRSMRDILCGLIVRAADTRDWEEQT